MSKKNTVQLPTEVAEQYQLVGWRGSARQFFGSKLGHVDISTLSLKHAGYLVRNGFRYLKPKPKASKEKDTPKSEK